MRAYRPGRMGSDEFNEEFQGQRQEKIELYALRAENGLPLFAAQRVPCVSEDQTVEPDGSADGSLTDSHWAAVAWVSERNARMVTRAS